MLPEAELITESAKLRSIISTYYSQALLCLEENVRIQPLLFIQATLTEPRWTPNVFFRQPLCILPLHSPPRNKTCAEDGEIPWWESLSEGSAEEERLLAKANRCLADTDAGVYLQHILKHKYLGVAYAKHPSALFLFLNFAFTSLLQQMSIGVPKITFLCGYNAASCALLESFLSLTIIS